MGLTDWLPLVKQKIRDTAGKLTDPEMVRAIGEAVNVYSKIRPREAVSLITGDGSKYMFDLPQDYEDGFSTMTGIEYPIGKVDPEYLDEMDWEVRRQPNNGSVAGIVKLHIFAPKIAATKNAYIYYRARHVVMGGDDTIPLVDREAVCGLAAAFSARELAAYYSQSSESTIAADAVSYRTKGQEYVALAKELEAAYVRHMAGSPYAANVNRDLDSYLGGVSGYDRFYHSGRSR